MSRKGKKKTTVPTQEAKPDVKEGMWNRLMGIRSNVSKFIKGLDQAQTMYVADMDYKKVVINDSPSGTGKTSAAVAKGMEKLLKGEIDHIHYVRFPDRRSDGRGTLPGDLDEKNDPYMRPLYTTLRALGLERETIQEMKDEELLVTSMDAYMRGDTLEDTFLILDEAQNGDVESFRLVLTRLQDRGCGVIIGHSGQMDNPVRHYGAERLNPFQVYQRHMLKKSFTAIHYLNHDYRGEISRWADQITETIQELDNQPVDTAG